MGRGNLIDGSDDHCTQKHLADGSMVLCEETEFPARRLILVLEHPTIGDEFWTPLLHAALADWAKRYPHGEMPVNHVYKHEQGTTISVIAPGMRESTGQADAWAPAPTESDALPALVNDLRALACEMELRGTVMAHFGSFSAMPEIAAKGRELVGAAGIAHQWADSIEQGGAKA